jgi:hypothetical protein
MDRNNLYNRMELACGRLIRQIQTAGKVLPTQVGLELGLAVRWTTAATVSINPAMGVLIPVLVLEPQQAIQQKRPVVGIQNGT